jgi:hypothetical protein
MSMIKSTPTFGLLVAVAAAVSSEASASAQIGPYDTPPVTFPSFAACRRALADQYSDALEGLRSAKPSTDSDWTNDFFTSKGVVDTGKNTAEYEGRRSYISVIKLKDGTFSSNSGANDFKYRCVGKVMSGSQYDMAVPGEPAEYPAVSRWNADRNAARYLEPKGTIPPPDVFTGTWKNAECYPAKEGAAEQCNAVRLAIVQRGESLCGVVRHADAAAAGTSDKGSTVVGTVVDGVAIMVVQGASQGSYLARASISSPGMGFRIVGGLAGATNTALEGVPITAHLMRDKSEMATAEMKRLSESCTWPQ